MGLADVRIAPHLGYVDSYIPVLTSSNSIGFQSETSFIKTAEPIYRTISTGSCTHTELVGYKNHSLVVSAVVNSFDNWNIKNMLGTSTGITVGGGSPSDESFQLVPGSVLSLRVEVVGCYYSKEKKLTLIIPKATILIGVEMNFLLDSLVENKVTIHAQPLINATWATEPLGRLLIEST
jgi:carbohydrate-binding DOMON domain-containing protein